MQEHLTALEELKPYEVFPWRDTFSIKIPHIDEQHKQLVQILNELCEHLNIRVKQGR